jgi:hypothetical protein
MRGVMVKRAESAFIPRNFLTDPASFGVDPAAAVRPGIPDADTGQLVTAFMQHRAACEVRRIRESGAITSRALALRLGHNEGTMSGYLRGVYPASLAEITMWAMELGDSFTMPNIRETFKQATAVE